MSILGTRVVRIEDPKFLTTGGVYGDDLDDERLAGAGHVFFVRSPIAHARITGIDTDAARSAPGVLGVYTAADLTDVPAVPAPFPRIPDGMVEQVLATDTVRFVGDRVAIVVTEQLYQGQDAVDLVMVDYEPLPPLTDPVQAVKDEQLLFESAGTNVVAAFGKPDQERPDIFAGCQVVVSEVVHNQRVAPAPMETRAGAAVWQDDRLIAWVSNQGAQGTRDSLAAGLGLDAAQVRVITPDVGGGFGAKFGADPEYVALGWLARTLDRPVRWAETRYENLVGMTHGRAQVQTITVGGRTDGTIEAYRLEVLQDSGAYPRFGAMLPMLTRLMATGTYAIERADAYARSVVTTTTPVAAYRGAGRPEATAAIERAVDRFAAEIGMDPADVRRRNLIPPFTEPHTTAFGAVYDTGDFAAALDKALQAADYDGLRAEQARRRERGEVRALGIGLSCYVEITGMGAEAGGPNENATVQVHADGTASILTGTSPHGQGHATVWASLASDQLGIPIDKITVIWGDTDLIPEGGGTGGSRSLQLGGSAVRQAAVELLEVARSRAAEELEANPDDLTFDLDSSSFQVAGVPSAAISLPELAAKQQLSVRSIFTSPGPTFPFGAHVAVVEVDTETGKVDLLRLVAADDAGTVLNPLIAEGQRHGGLAQGAAQALYEEVRYDEDGNPMTASFADYPFPSAAELPSFELVDSQTPTTYNPLGAKGIGEAGSIGSTPAVQNAVIDAVAHLGVRHIDMPTTPQRVFDAIQHAQETQR